MQINVGRVLSVKDENKVIAQSIIENTTYDKAGYRITHFSMGKGTAMSPESYDAPAMIMVNQGRLQLYLISGRDSEEMVLKQGQGFIRPKNKLIAYVSDDADTIFTESRLKSDSQVSTKLTGKPFYMNLLVHYEPGQISHAHLINDERFKYDMYSYAEVGQKELCFDQYSHITCIEGKVELVHGEKHNVLKVTESFIVAPHESYTMFYSGHTKAAFLTLFD